MRILIIEDDIKLCNIIQKELTRSDYIVDTCHTGSDSIYYTSRNIYDLIILDRMLPELDGLTLLRTIRSKNITTPVIFVTALGGVNDKIDGLDAGADDYITKPFDMNELKARIRALLRRPQELNLTELLTYANLTLDLKSKTLSTIKSSCVLSKKEMDILQFFILNKDQVLSRELLMTRIWGPDNFVMESNLDTYISFVRRRLKCVQSTAQIKTIHSIGYRMEEIQCTPN